MWVSHCNIIANLPQNSNGNWQSCCSLFLFPCPKKPQVADFSKKKSIWTCDFCCVGRCTPFIIDLKILHRWLQGFGSKQGRICHLTSRTPGAGRCHEMNVNGRGPARNPEKKKWGTYAELRKRTQMQLKLEFDHLNNNRQTNFMSHFLREFHENLHQILRFYQSKSFRIAIWNSLFWVGTMIHDVNRWFGIKKSR